MGLLNFTIIGNLGADATTRQVGERNVITFNMAVSDTYRDRNGERKERTQWFRVDYWTNNTGLVQYLTKGKTVAAVGNRLETYSGQGANGQYTYVTLNATNVVFVGGGNTQNATAPAQAAPAPRPQTAPAPQAQAAPQTQADEDLPF